MRRYSLAVKIAAANILLVLFAVFAVVALTHRRDRLLLAENSLRDLARTVAAGAALVEGSGAGELENGLDLVRSPKFVVSLRLLQRANPAVERLHLIVRGSSGDFLIVDEKGERPAASSLPAAGLGLSEVFEDGVPFAGPMHPEADQEWLSARHPVRNAKGRVVAAVVGYVHASALEAQAHQSLLSTLVPVGIAVLAAILLSLFIARRVTKPLQLVAESASCIASGNLNVRLNFPSRDELGDLVDSFNQMVQRLAASAQEQTRLQQQLLDRQRIEQELRLAAVIQQSFLPTAFPRSERFRTNARSVSAQVVGGDFYDFLELPGGRLGIVVGDVAGRGIAAALFSARVIRDFRAAALRTEGPGEALEWLNQQLLQRATRGMFVTLLYLVLDTNTGAVCYSSGGHLPPLRRSGRTGAVDILHPGYGLPLGVAPTAGVAEQRLRLEPDDVLLLVTDGVVEGLSSDHHAFGLESVVEVFQRQGADESRLVDSVLDEVIQSAPGHIPRDDMAVVSLAWGAGRDPAFPA